MNIGLDFDGVITNCGKLKTKGAKRLFNIYIPAKQFKKELVIEAGLLTLDQYRYLQKQIYGTREFGLLMESVKDALEYLPKLQEEGHIIKIITSREAEFAAIAEGWMHQRNIFSPLISAGYGNSKEEACKGLQVYVDDDIDKLEALQNVVPYRYLFNWDYNKHITCNTRIAQRISSWKELYAEIQQVSNKIP